MPSFSTQMVMPAVYNVSEKEMKKKDYGRTGTALNLCFYIKSPIMGECHDYGTFPGVPVGSVFIKQHFL